MKRITSKPVKPSKKSSTSQLMKAANRLEKKAGKAIKKQVKKINKKIDKKVHAYELNAQKWEATRQRARGYVSDLQAQGFYIDDATARLLNYKGPERMTKKKLDQLRKSVTKSRLNSVARKEINQWEKVIYKSDLNSGSITHDTAVSSDKKAGALDVSVLSDMSYKTWKKLKDNPTSDSRELANILNGLIGYQKNHFITTETLLSGKVWKLAKKLNGGQIPNPQFDKYGHVIHQKDANGNPIKEKWEEYFTISPHYIEEHYATDADGDHYVKQTRKSFGYDPSPNAVYENQFALFRSIHFKKIPAQFKNDVMEIAEHPQTSEELYSQFRNSSSFRTYKAHYEKLVQQLSQQNQIPPAAVGVLLWIMQTSQSWYVAGKDYLPSAQFTSNWRHIYADIAQLEKLPQTERNSDEIDQLIDDIMSNDTNTKDISNRVEAILQRNKMHYHNIGKIY